MSEKRIAYLDILRGGAAWFIIMIHISTIGLRESEIGSLNWSICLVYNSISRWAVPVFFMISGVLFCDPSREISAHRLWKKNIFRILLAIVFWGFFYILLDQYVYSTLSVKTLLIAMYGIITGNTGYHLWFLYDLMMLYIGIPIFRLVTRHATRKQMEYLLAIWFFASICVSHINEIAGSVFGISSLLPYNAYPIAGYAGYFLLGYYLHRYPLSCKMKKMVYFAGILSAVALPALNIIFSCYMGVSSVGAFSSPKSIGVCFMSVAIWLFVSEKEKCLGSVRQKSIMCFISKHSFGIYLIHPFWITVIFHICQVDWAVTAVASVLVVPLIATGIGAISLICSMLLSRIPGIKRIVGG